MISYSAEGVKFPHIKKRETTNWIRRVAESYGKKIGEIAEAHVPSGTLCLRIESITLEEG